MVSCFSAETGRRGLTRGKNRTSNLERTEVRGQRPDSGPSRQVEVPFACESDDSHVVSDDEHGNLPVFGNDNWTQGSRKMVNQVISLGVAVNATRGLENPDYRVPWQ